MKSPLGRLDPQHRDVHIYGAGIAGLLMAHFLSRQGYHIHLYEKSSRVGGKIRSHQLTEGIIEEAANAVYATEEVEGWLNSLGLTPVATTPHLKRRIWNGRSVSPMSFALIAQLLDE